MDKKQRRLRHLPYFWKNPVYWLRRVYGEIYSRWQKNFNPKWREHLPSIPCQYCGQIDHKEAYCPNLRKLGFLDDGKNKPRDNLGGLNQDNIIIQFLPMKISIDTSKNNEWR